MKIDLSKINLNLLIALDALLKERHVTNAGKHLNITQSAMSNLLKQLREIFKDKLFVRGQASSIIPTSFALSLEPRLAEAIQKINLIFQEPEIFKPDQVKITFTIGLSDYSEGVLFSVLAKKIITQAPGVNIVIKHINYIKNKSIFEQENIDLAIGIYSTIPETLIAQKLFTEKAVFLGAKKNPILNKPISAKIFAETKQLAIQFFENREELLTEKAIKKLCLDRKAIITHPHALSSPYILMETDLVSLTLERLAKQFIKIFPLTYQPLSFFSATYDVYMVWHPKDKNDMAHRWLRETVISVAKTIE